MNFSIRHHFTFTGLTAPLLAVALVCAGCGTRPSTVALSDETAASLSADQLSQIEAGRVLPGFTEEMVLASVGRPDRKARRVTADGETEEWIYEERDRGPRLSFGVGAGTARGGGAYGGGVSVSPGSRPPEERLRITFSGGRVTEVSARETDGR